MISHLEDTTLFRQQNLIAGQWREAPSERQLKVVSPASADVVGYVPAFGAAETRECVEAAAAAFPAWAALSAKDRARVLRRWGELLVENVADLARILTAEQGKPLAEARAEILHGAAFFEWFAEEGKRAYGDIIPTHAADKRLLVLKQPVGVCAAITPWNFPAAMITRKVAPALAAGCTMVLKPASQTPFTALAIGVLGERAGVPPGVFSIVTGSAREIGAELTSNPTVRKLTFTGSTEIGKQLMAQCAPTVKKVSMELGGNAPFIVFDDADIDAAVNGTMISKFRNAGQTCVCANRIFVQRGIYDRFTARLCERVSALKVGRGDEAGTELGPLIDAAAVAKVEDHIADALKRGASVVNGGRRHALGGNFFEPTVVRDARPDMKIFREEIFGPVAPLFVFDTEDEVIALANDTEFGLASYVYTRDLARTWRVSERLECGIVAFNDGIVSSESAPFGGVKESGVGREGSKYGLEDFMHTKYVLHGGIASI